MIKLYHSGTSVCSKKVRLTLAEKGLAWDGEILDLSRGDQFAPDYVRLNPNAYVPTLIDDGRVICESTVIDEYLDDAYPEPPLKPAEPYARAQMRLWTRQLDDDVHEAINTVTFAIALRHPEIEKPAAEREARIQAMPDPAARDKLREMIELGVESPRVVQALGRLDRLLADMEAALAAGGPWLAGEGFSLADTGVIPYLDRMRLLALDGLWAERHHVADWFARAQARPSFAAAITAFDPPARVAMMHGHGERAWPRVRELIDRLDGGGTAPQCAG